MAAEKEEEEAASTSAAEGKAEEEEEAAEAAPGKIEGWGGKEASEAMVGLNAAAPRPGAAEGGSAGIAAAAAAVR